MRISVLLLLVGLLALAAPSLGASDALVVQDTEGELPVTSTGRGAFIGATCGRTDFTQATFHNATDPMAFTFRVRNLTATCPGEPPAGAAGAPRVRFTTRAQSETAGALTITMDLDPSTGRASTCHHTERPDETATVWCHPRAIQVADPETGVVSYRIDGEYLTPPASVIFYSEASWDACGVTAPCTDLRPSPYRDRMPDKGEIRFD